MLFDYLALKFYILVLHAYSSGLTTNPVISVRLFFIQSSKTGVLQSPTPIDVDRQASKNNLASFSDRQF